MKFIKNIIAVILAVVMALPLAACGEDTTWVYDYEGEKISSGLYLTFLMGAYSEAMNHEDTDTSINELFKQTLEEKTAEQWILDKAKEEADNYIAIERKFDELGLTLTESNLNEIEVRVESIMSNYEALYKQNGVGEKSVRLLVTNQKKEELIFNKYYGTDGIEEVPNDNLLEHFKDNYLLLNIFSMQMETGDTLTDEQVNANKALKEKADKYAELINSKQKTFNEVLDEYTHEINETEHSEDDSNDIIKKDEDTKSLYKTDTIYIPEKVIESITNIKEYGVATVIAGDTAYYVVVRYDVTEDESNFDEMKSTLLYDIKSEEFNKHITEWSEGLASTSNTASLKRYKAKKINFNLD